MQLFSHFPCHYTATLAHVINSLTLILNDAEFSFDAVANKTVNRKLLPFNVICPLKTETFFRKFRFLLCLSGRFCSVQNAPAFRHGYK